MKHDAVPCKLLCPLEKPGNRSAVKQSLLSSHLPFTRITFRPFILAELIIRYPCLVAACFLTALAGPKGCRLKTSPTSSRRAREHEASIDCFNIRSKKSVALHVIAVNYSEWRRLNRSGWTSALPLFSLPAWRLHAVLLRLQSLLVSLAVHIWQCAVRPVFELKGCSGLFCSVLCLFLCSPSVLDHYRLLHFVMTTDQHMSDLDFMIITLKQTHVHGPRLCSYTAAATRMTSFP